MKKTIILGIAIASIASTALGNISVNGLSFNAGNSALGQIFFDTVGGTVANNTVKFDVIFGASSGSLTDSSPTTYTIGSTDQGFMNAGTINVTTGSLGGGSAGFYQVRAWTGGTTFADVANTHSVKRSHGRIWRVALPHKRFQAFDEPCRISVSGRDNAIANINHLSVVRSFLDNIRQTSVEVGPTE